MIKYWHFALALVISNLITLFFMAGRAPADSILPHKGEYVISLPEEIDQSKGMDLKGYKHNDTIFIQFGIAERYQIFIDNDSLYIKDGDRSVGAESRDDDMLDEMIREDCF